MSLHASSESAPVTQFGALTRVDPLAPEWNLGLRHFEDATIFHTSEWARVLIDSYGYSPYYFTGQHGGHPIRLCLFEIDSWLTGKRAASLPFADEACILGHPPAAGLKAILTAISPLAHQNGWKSVEVRGAPESWDEGISNSFYSHELDLSVGGGELFRNFHESVRRAVRKAGRLGVQVEIRQDETAVREYFELHCLTRRKHGIPPQPVEFFRSIHRHIIEQGLGFTVLALNGGKAVAGAIFFRFGSKALYKFGASNPAMDAFRPSNLVMWSAIEHLSAIGVTSLNFGRTDLGHDGLRRYKLGWGSKESVISYLQLNPQNGSFLNGKSSPRPNTLLRLFPVWALKRVGELIYRHTA